MNKKTCNNVIVFKRAQFNVWMHILLAVLPCYTGNVIHIFFRVFDNFVFIK